MHKQAYKRTPQRSGDGCFVMFIQHWISMLVYYPMEMLALRRCCFWRRCTKSSVLVGLFYPSSSSRRSLRGGTERDAGLASRPQLRRPPQSVSPRPSPPFRPSADQKYQPSSKTLKRLRVGEEEMRVNQTCSMRFLSPGSGFTCHQPSMSVLCSTSMTLRVVRGFSRCFECPMRDGGSPTIMRCISSSALHLRNSLESDLRHGNNDAMQGKQTSKPIHSKCIGTHRRRCEEVCRAT